MLDGYNNANQLEWEISDGFKPSRGVRQGDPLSAYIFVFFIEHLSQLIIQEVNMGYWQAIRLGENDLPLSHLFFVDDLVLFGNASYEQVLVMEYVFNYFYGCPG